MRPAEMAAAMPAVVAARVMRPAVTVVRAPVVAMVMMISPAVPGVGGRDRRHEAERADAGEREQDLAHGFPLSDSCFPCGIRFSLNADACVRVPRVARRRAGVPQDGHVRRPCYIVPVRRPVP